MINIGRLVRISVYFFYQQNYCNDDLIYLIYLDVPFTF